MTGIAVGVGIGPFNTVAPAAWVPSDSSDLALWLRSDLGVTESGGLVSAWADQSGTGKADFTAAGADRPTYTASNATFNGHPSIDPDGNDRMLSGDIAATWNFLHDGTGMTIAVVYEVTSAGRLIDNVRGAATLRGIDYDAKVTPSTSLYRAMNGTTAIYGLAPAEVAGARYSVWRSATGGSPAEIDLRVNGTSVASASYGAAASAVDATNALALFATSGAEAGNMTGACAEIIFFSAYLGAADLANLESYLSTRYAL